MYKNHAYIFENQYIVMVVYLYMLYALKYEKCCFKCCEFGIFACNFLQMMLANTHLRLIKSFCLLLSHKRNFMTYENNEIVEDGIARTDKTSLIAEDSSSKCDPFLDKSLVSCLKCVKIFTRQN